MSEGRWRRKKQNLFYLLDWKENKWNELRIAGGQLHAEWMKATLLRLSFCGLGAAPAAMLRKRERTRRERVAELNGAMRERAKWRLRKKASWWNEINEINWMKSMRHDEIKQSGAHKAKPIISFTPIVIEMLVVAALAPLLFISFSSFLSFSFWRRMEADKREEGR